MVSKFYEENWEKANKWLEENAPDYVLRAVKELDEVVTRGSSISSEKADKMAMDIINGFNLAFDELLSTKEDFEDKG